MPMISRVPFGLQERKAVEGLLRLASVAVFELTPSSIEIMRAMLTAHEHERQHYLAPHLHSCLREIVPGVHSTITALATTPPGTMIYSLIYDSAPCGECVRPAFTTPTPTTAPPPTLVPRTHGPSSRPPGPWPPPPHKTPTRNSHTNTPPSNRASVVQVGTKQVCTKLCMESEACLQVFAVLRVRGRAHVRAGGSLLVLMPKEFSLATPGSMVHISCFPPPCAPWGFPWMWM